MLRELLPRALVPRMRLSSSSMIGISIIPFALGLRRNSLCTAPPPPTPQQKLENSPVLSEGRGGGLYTGSGRKLSLTPVSNVYEAAAPIPLL